MRFKELDALQRLLEGVEAADPTDEAALVARAQEIDDLVREYGGRIQANEAYFDLYTPCPIFHPVTFDMCLPTGHQQYCILVPGEPCRLHNGTTSRDWYAEQGQSGFSNVWNELQLVLEKAFSLNLARRSLQIDPYVIPEGLGIG